MAEELDTAEIELKAIVPLAAVREQVIPFYGDPILVVAGEDGKIYVPLRPLAQFLGLSWSGQFERTKNDPVVGPQLRMVRVSRADSTGGAPELLALPLDLLFGWLFNIEVRRVKPPLREKILRYQLECHRVLAQAFQAEAQAVVVSSATIQELMQIRDTGLAIARMAEEHIAMEHHLQTLDARMDRASAIVQDLRRRLGNVERRLDPANVITEEQAATLLSAVKSLGVLLARQDGRNHFQEIWTEIHRLFRVPDYHHIRQEQYADVVALLQKWLDATLEGGTKPGP